jgi:signal transduction histidine kinase
MRGSPHIDYLPVAPGVALGFADTERRDALRYRALAEEQEALRHIATLVASGAEPDVFFDELSCKVAAVLRCDGACVFQFGHAGDHAVIVGACDRSRELSAAVGRRIPLDQAPSLYELHRTGAPQHASGAPPLFPGIAERAAAPIHVNGTLWGALGIAGSAAAPLPSDAATRLAVFTEVVDLAVTATEARSVLVERVDRLEEIDRLKDEFISLVTHELRTPLTSITGYLDVLDEDETLTTEQAKFVEIARRNAGRLGQMVDQLLTLFRVQSGREVGDPEWVDLGAVVGQTVEAIEPVAERGGVTVAFDSGDDVRAFVRAESIAQVADNLVANAVKYTKPGGTVRVALTTNGDGVELTVADDGIGIPADELPRLFERFFRASSAVEEQIPGTGLGLAVTKALVDGAGGAIDVRSELGRGTHFTVRVPVVR